ncbi:hypothetical protein KQX54_013145 [Cotesia glomerata]|uniref:Reverse transcriptase domain-containing protein n=1 Tax=Cotesia glomerata TaxID=32391 RepID=A0AAV7I344_COTGL|nr:hypothetical protein KQX54_013145 [Cotesia glomerata]
MMTYKTDSIGSDDLNSYSPDSDYQDSDSQDFRLDIIPITQNPDEIEIVCLDSDEIDPDDQDFRLGDFRFEIGETSFIKLIPITLGTYDFPLLPNIII